MKKTNSGKSKTDEPKAKSAEPVRKRILLADDHPMMRAGLAQLINRQPEMEVCAEAGKPSEVLSLLKQVKPDLILTDLTMPGPGPGLSSSRIWRCSIRVWLSSSCRCMTKSSMPSGACAPARGGYIMKESGSENLLVALRCVLGGQTYVSPTMSERILSGLSNRKPRGSDSPIQNLSDREFEVFQLVGQGKSTRDIARELHLSPKTVDVHRTHIREKLELKDATALVRHAVRWIETQGAGT